MSEDADVDYLMHLQGKVNRLEAELRDMTEIARKARAEIERLRAAAVGANVEANVGAAQTPVLRSFFYGRPKPDDMP
jgi:hypothetical protein